MKFIKISKVLSDEEANEKYGPTYIEELKKQLEMLKENTNIILSKFEKLGKEDYSDLYHIHEIANAFAKVNDRLESLNEDLGITRK